MGLSSPDRRQIYREQDKFRSANRKLERVREFRFVMLGEKRFHDSGPRKASMPDRLSTPATRAWIAAYRDPRAGAVEGAPGKIPLVLRLALTEFRTRHGVEPGCREQPEALLRITNRHCPE